MKLIAEVIEVRLAPDGSRPINFVWRLREYKIVEVLAATSTVDFRRPWWRRKHRDLYRVAVDTGQVFEIYFHRGPGKKYWVLSREL